MYPVQFNKQHTHRPQTANVTLIPRGVEPILRWLGLSIRKLQQRRMIAALHALDDRILWDIGMERCDIERTVRGFNEHEVKVMPLAAPPRVHLDQPLQQAA